MTRILIVDDSPEILTWVGDQLGKLGHQVDSSLYPDHLFDLLDHAAPDLLLLDMHMPVIDGLTLLHQLKQNPRHQEIPVIMLTGDANEDLMERCFEAGAFDFINKPVNLPALRARTASALSHRNHIQALKRENERKSVELEEARRLQLGMLPKKLTLPQGYTAAAHMQTATEVGGDYYDLVLQNDDLALAVGDATGHGLQAGAMVIAVKGLFNAQAHRLEPDALLRETSQTLTSMGFDRIFMALTCARLRNHQLTVSHGGMPFTVIYRAATKTVEELAFGGLPLGAMPFPYQARTVDLHPGDSVLLMSDGLPECFNPQEEMLGREAVTDAFTAVAHLDPQAGIDHLTEMAKRFAAGRPLDDDLTLLILKREPHHG